MNLIDRAIAVISPSWALSRVQARASMQQIDAFSGVNGPYAAADLRPGRRPAAMVKENAVPRERLNRIRGDSWDLYRDNGYARKIVRSLESKIIGQGMLPESLATNEDGSPAVEFRARAKRLWMSIQSGFDFRGLPGRGGQTFAGLQRLALRSCVLSGNTLYRLVPVDVSEQQQRDIPIPLTLQMIDAARLADSVNATIGTIPEENAVYHGIEFNKLTGKRVAYWIGTFEPGAITPTFGEAVRVPAEQIGHLYIEDDIDQMFGTPWFAASLLGMRDTGDLQYNTVKASASAACLVVGYRKPTGASRFGLNASSEYSPTSADGSDLTDEDGNMITKIQPNMFVNLGRDGELNMLSPNQPNTNVEAFIQHMLRGTAASLPGIKGSTVTGDYRNSSFSSERSADNDCWPEIQALQEWFSTSFCQPIFEAVVRAGVLSGYFENVINADEFQANPGRYLESKWQGPVQLSINPVDDINAAALAMHHGLSSLQMECAKRNINWRDVVKDNVEVRAAAEEAKLPQEFINNIYGVDAQDVIAQNIVATSGNEQPQGAAA